MQLTVFNGSPRGRKGNSQIVLDQFLKGFEATLGNSYELYFLNRLQDMDQLVQAFGEAETVLLAHPLYTDAMPAIVKAFIEELEPYLGRENNPSLGFIVQSGFVEAARQSLGISTVNRVGSVGLKVALVARGGCDLYLATTISKEWDICAPHALLIEAGGILTNLCGEPLVYNKPDVAECLGLAASNGQAHAWIVDALAPLLDRFEG